MNRYEVLKLTVQIYNFAFGIFNSSFCFDKVKDGDGNGEGHRPNKTKMGIIKY